MKFSVPPAFRFFSIAICALVLVVLAVFPFGHDTENGNAGGSGSAGATFAREVAQQDSKSSKDHPRPGEYFAGQLVVQFEKSATSDQRVAARRKINAKLKQKLPVSGVELLTLPEGTAVAKARRTISKQDGVAFSEPNFKVSSTMTPNDARFGELWGMNNPGGPTGVADADIDAPEAWDVTRGSANVRVGVLDTGVDYLHPDLDGQIWTNPGETGTAANGADKRTNNVDDDLNGRRDDWRGFDFMSNDNNPMDDYGHGSHVAGTIAAEGHNGIGVAGVAWDSKLVPLKVLGPSGGSTFNVTAGIEYAGAMGLQVVNGSLGYETSGAPSEAERAAIEAYPNTLFVFSAGNSGRDNEGAVKAYPCSHPSKNIVCVGASDSSDIRSVWPSGQSSNWGSTRVDLFAPGSDILSVKWAADSATNPAYMYAGGTSMAAPHVAGIAALLRSKEPQAEVSEVKTALMKGTDPVPALSTLSVSGGRANAVRALAEVSNETRSNYFTFEDGELVVHGAANLTHDVTVNAGSDWLQISDSQPLDFRGTQNCTAMVPSRQQWSCSLSVGTARIVTGDLVDQILVLGNVKASIQSRGGNDTVTGGALADTIDGGTGADLMYGGGGTDTVTYAGATGPVNVTLDGNPNDGISGEGDNIKYGVERLMGSGFGDTLSGSEAADELVGGPGNDTLRGQGGDDNLIGGTGNDIFHGDAGLDSADYSMYTESVDLSIDNTADDGGYSEDDDIRTTVESLYAGSGNDRLEGTSGSNVLDGAAGNDQVTYIYRPEALTITLDNLPGDGAPGENDLLLNFERVFGGDGPDNIVGNSADNTFQGGDGADTIQGGAGKDAVWYDEHTGPVNVSLGDPQPDGEVGEGDNIASGVEDVLGTYGDDVLRGDSGDNDLEGRGGADQIFGGAGNDRFPDDAFLGNSDAGDVYDGGDGSDLLLASGNGAVISLDDQANDGPATTGAIRTDNAKSNIERLEGTIYNDTLRGNDLPNSIWGQQGDDVIEGLGGNDYLNGNGSGDLFGCANYSGNDVLRGGDGNDRVVGGNPGTSSTAARIYDGGAGDDTVRVAQESVSATCANFGLTGTPQVIGGAGKDLLDLTADSTSTGYYINLNGLQDDGPTLDVDTSTKAINVPDDFEDITGSAGNDVLIGSAGANTLRGGGGRDFINGSGGADAVFGEAGDDVLQSSDGVADTHNCGDGGGDQVIDDTIDNRIDCEGAVTDPVRAKSISGTATLDLRQSSANTASASGNNITGRTSLFSTGAVMLAETGCRQRSVESASCVVASQINVNGGPMVDDVSVSGYTGATRFIALGGNDRLSSSSTGATVFDGGSGNDYALTGGGNDQLSGGPGVDSLNSAGGDDSIRSLDGEADTVICGLGTDSARTDTTETTISGCESTAIPEPTTTITSGPAAGSTVATQTATFGFTSNVPWATFECQLDAGAWQACASPWTTPQYGQGSRTFSVRAVDHGVLDSTPASVTFTAAWDTTPPTLTVTSPVAGSTAASSSALLTFSVGADSVSTVCTFQGRPAISPCITGQAVHNLTLGTQTLTVTAEDQWGNVATRTVQFTLTGEPGMQVFSGGMTASIPTVTTNLTTLGTTDWVKFRSADPADIERKHVAAPLIGPVTQTGTGTLSTVDASNRQFAWTDGTPTSSGSNALGIATSGVGSGFRFNVPMNFRESLWVRMQVTATNAGFTASALSDGTPYPLSFTVQPSTSQVQRDIKFRYRPRNPAGNLQLDVKQDSSTNGTGIVAIHAIQVYPDPDATDPETSITAGPAEGATVPSPVSFTFGANEQANFQCAIDWAAWSTCSNPYSKALGVGRHFLRVRAVDTAGNWDESIEVRNFTIG